MTALIKLNPLERALVESGVNRYAIKGPGVVWLKPWDRLRAKLYTGFQMVAVDCQNARLAEDIPVHISIKVGYCLNLDKLQTADYLLPRVPALNDGGWREIVRWRVEAAVQRVVPKYTWRSIKDDTVLEEIETSLKKMLTERLDPVCLKLMNLTVVRTDLDEHLQRTVVRVEQAWLEAQKRAEVLESYKKIFGDDLYRAMPYIFQWDLMNMLHKSGNAHLVMAADGLKANGTSPDGHNPWGARQLVLPFLPTRNPNPPLAE